MLSDLLILHGGALGDLVLTLQLALRLSGVGAGRKLVLVSRTNPGDLSNCQPSVQRIAPEGVGLHWLHAESNEAPPQTLSELVAGRTVLNALTGLDSAVHRRLSTLEAEAVYSFDPRPEPGLDAHITTQWQRELEAQALLFPKGDRQNPESAKLTVPDAVRQCGRATLAKLGVRRRPILIHPGSGGVTKCWPLRCFLDVARRLRETGFEVCLVTGPVEAERWPADDLEVVRREFPLLESPGPDELLRVLAAARMLISNDAGPAHLAALLGIPSVTVFGPTSPLLWRPLGPVARVIAGDPRAFPDDWGVDAEQVVALVGDVG